MFLKEKICQLLLYIDKKTNEAKQFNAYKNIIIGKGSVLYSEANILEMRESKNSIKIGENSHIRGELITFNYGGLIEIGDNSFLGVGSKIWSGDSIKIGSNVLISHNVNIIDTNSHEINYLQRAEEFINIIKNGHPKTKGTIKTSPIVIKDYAWISFNSIILKGVKIGKGAIVAAGSVVTKDVPDFCVVAGNPAKIVNKLIEDNV